MEEIFEWVVSINKIYFPKYVKAVKCGDYAIFSAFVISEDKKIVDDVVIKGTLTCDLDTKTKYKVQVKKAEKDREGRESHELIYINRKINFQSLDGQRGFLEMILPKNTVNELLRTHSNVIEILENKNVKELLKVKGIGPVRAVKILDKYEQTKDLSEIYAKIGQFGISNTLIKKIVDHYGSAGTVINVLENNPYKLVAVDGIGFKKADNIALKLGIDIHDHRRIDGCIIYTLAQAGESGKSFLGPKQLMDELKKNLGEIDAKTVRSRLDFLNETNEIKLFLDDKKVALTRYFNLEKNICKELLRLMEGYNPKDNSENKDYVPSTPKYKSIEEKLKEIEKQQGYEFNEKQKEAIQLCLKHNVVALTGLAGTGKTTAANGIAKIYEGLNIVAVALSGKASVRLAEATGIDAKTIHRALEYNNGAFLFNRNNKLEADVVIIDEATMINGSLFLSLLEAIPSGAKVIIMGDIQQLTPIGNCHVFADILNSNIIPSVRLTEIHRQAMRSGIIPTSIKVAKQEQLFDKDYTGNQIVGELLDMELDIHSKNDEVFDAVIKKFKTEFLKTNNILETQIICPMKNRGLLNCYSINTEIQKMVNPIKDGKFIEVPCGKKHDGTEGTEDIKLVYKIGVGDKVINTKNNYSALDPNGDSAPIFNGNIGIVTSIDEDACVVDFVGIGEVALSHKETNSLELAYAITIHKSQGSGFDNVIVAIDDESNGLLNNAEILYTAITRAKKYCTLIATNNAVRTSIRSKETVVKQTFLPDFFNKKYSID